MNEYELLYAIHQMDEEAVELLVQLYQKKIYQTIRRVMSETNYVERTSAEIEEMVQLANCSLLQAVENYCDEGIPFQFFALKYIEMAIKKYIRSMRCHANAVNAQALSLDRKISEESTVYHVDSLVNNHKEYEPQYMLHQLEKERLIVYLKNNLSHTELHVFELMMKGYTYKEIGIMISKSPRNVAYVVGKVKKLLLTYID